MEECEKEREFVVVWNVEGARRVAFGHYEGIDGGALIRFRRKDGLLVLIPVHEIVKFEEQRSEAEALAEMREAISARRHPKREATR